MTDLIDAPAVPRPAIARTGRPVDQVPAPSPSPAAPAGAAGLSGRARPLLRPALYYLLSRCALLGATLVARSMFPKLRVFQALGTAWDGRWYLSIAQHGYPHHLYNEGDGSRWAFFPGFPMVVRAMADVTRLTLPDAAVVVAFVLGLTSALAVWLAVREIFGAHLADRAVLLFVFFPTAYVLSLAYSEGLFLTAAATCLFALSRRYWVTAALCACVAGLTRNAGVVVIAAVLVTALPAAWRGRQWRPLVAASIAPLGLASFMVYGWAMVGTPVAFLSAERFWQGQHFIWFLSPVLALVDAVHFGPASTAFLPDTMAAVALFLGFLGLRLLDRMSGRVRNAAGSLVAVPTSWWVYTAGTLLVAYSAYFTDSILRYAMAAFPLFVAFAWKLPRSMEGAVVGVMACLQGALLVAVLCAAVHPTAVPLLP